MAQYAVPMLLLGGLGVALPIILGRMTRKRNDYGLSTSRAIAEADAKANPIQTSPTAPNASSNTHGSTTVSSVFGTTITIPGRGPSEPLTTKQKTTLEKSRVAEAPIYANDGLWTSAHNTRSFMSAMPAVFQTADQHLPLGDHMQRYRQIARPPKSQSKQRKPKQQPTSAAAAAPAAAVPAAVSAADSKSA